MKITTNNQQRCVKYGYEMPYSKYSDFDYIGEYDSDDFKFHSFVEYKGEWYDLSEFMRIDGAVFGELKDWHGYQSDSYFSGIVVRYCNDNDCVIVGRYCC